MPDLNQFHELVKKGNVEGVRAALAEDPGLLNETNASGQNAFVLAKYYRQDAVANELLDRRPKLDIFGHCIAGHTEDVLEELQRRPELLESHSSDGWTPLHLAAFFGHPELATALLDRGADIEARSTNPSKNTPLHAATAGGHAQIVRLLLLSGANPRARQEGGWTALHSAAQAGNREMVEELVAHGADINARADNNQSPLDLALTRGQQGMVTLLEALGAKLQ